MNFKLVLVSALAAGWITAPGMAQTAGPQAPAAPTTAPAAPPLPQAIPAKIAIIEFLDAAAATNEGQKAIDAVQKKYEPQKASLDALAAEIESLTKQLQSAPATMSEDEKASRARTIDTKQKQLQRDSDDAKSAYGGDVQEAVFKVAQKFYPVAVKYAQANGFTMLVDNTGEPQQGGLRVLWAPGTDISVAAIEAYNATTPGIAPPAPSAPAAARPAAPKPAAPKPAAPKQ
jgi:outer membrane protein